MLEPVVGPRSPFCEPPPLDGSLSAQVDTEFRWQAQRMPAFSRRLLLDRDDPASVSAIALIDELHLETEADARARRALGMRAHDAVHRAAGILPQVACKALREAVDAESQQKVDTVDGAPDHQLNMSRERLDALIGPEAAAALWRLPACLLYTSPSPRDS